MTEYGTQDGSAGEKVRAGQGRSGEVRAGQVRSGEVWEGRER